MARKRRYLQHHTVYHVFNRRTDKQCLFATPDAYEDFLRVLARGKRKFAVRLHAYCLMQTHWHLALSADDVSVMAQFLRWTATTHAVRFRFQTGTRGQGHVYQDRYKAVAIDGAVHYATVLRYIEANALAAGVVRRAEDWRWSSLHERRRPVSKVIDAGPWTLPPDWLALVNSPVARMELLPSLLGQEAKFRPNACAFPELL